MATLAAPLLIFGGCCSNVRNRVFPVSIGLVSNQVSLGLCSRIDSKVCYYVVYNFKSLTILRHEPASGTSQLIGTLEID
jgi:hypothetical protein